MKSISQSPMRTHNTFFLSLKKMFGWSLTIALYSKRYIALQKHLTIRYKTDFRCTSTEKICTFQTLSRNNDNNFCKLRCFEPIVIQSPYFCDVKSKFIT